MLTTDFLNNTTRENFLPTVKNQVYDKTVVFSRLYAGGRVKDMTGRSLLWDVVAKKHTAKGLYSGYDTLASQPVNPTAQATLPPAFYYSTVAISGPEERMNTGNKEKLIDMLKTQFDNANATFKDDMATDLYADGSTIGGKQPIVGLAAIVAAGTTTYANITRSTANAYWKANVDSSAHTYANASDPTTAEYLPKLIGAQWLAATHDKSPNLLVTTKAIFQMYQDLAGIQNLRINNKEANLGFASVAFGPGVEFTFDTYCTTAYLYGLTLDDFQFYVLPGANFDMKDPGWQVPPNQDAKIAQILWNGQLRCDTPREQFVIQSIATS